MYLVDTNVLSEARRGRAEAREWMRAADPDQVFLSVVTLGEIMKGVALKSRTDATAAEALLGWLDGLRTRHQRRILPVTGEVAIEWGRLAAQRPRNMADGLIAATAIVHGATLVTRNATDFRDIPVRLIDPWNVRP